MCAIPDKAATEEFRNRKGRQRAYKVIRKSTAKPNIFYSTGVTFSPGHNVDRKAVKTYLGYSRGCCRGFHCYLDRNHACTVRDQAPHITSVVCVTFAPTDVIVAEATCYHGSTDRRTHRQIVVRALHISERAWKQAGLPATKGGAS